MPSFKKSLKGTYPVRLKLISGLLAAAFCLQDLAWAAPEIRLPAILPVPSFSPAVASIEDRLAGLPGKPVVFLVRDAHVNESAQRNIASILSSLAEKEKTNLFFIEGGWGELSVSKLFSGIPVHARKKLIEPFIKKGWIQGPDQADLVSEKPLHLIGVEDRKLYKEAVEDYRRTTELREHAEGWLANAARLSAFLKSRLYHSELLELDAARAKFRSNEGSFIQYIDQLLGSARDHGIRTEKWTSIQQLQGLRSLEENIDFAKARREQAAAVASLPDTDRADLAAWAREQSNRPARLSINDHFEEKGFHGLLKQKIKNPSLFPVLSRYWEYLEAARRINAADLTAQCEALEEELWSALPRSPEERELLAADRSIETMQQLIQLKIDSAQWEKIASGKAVVRPTDVAGYLNARLIGLGARHEFSLFQDQKTEDAVSSALEFYKKAFLRDEFFVQKILSTMRESGQTRAALVAGGFHTDHLKKLLKKQDVSFVSVVPQVYSETNPQKYESLLLGNLQSRSRASSFSKIAVEPLRWAVVPGTENVRILSILRKDGARLTQDRTQQASSHKSSLFDPIDKVKIAIAVLSGLLHYDFSNLLIFIFDGFWAYITMTSFFMGGMPFYSRLTGIKQDRISVSSVVTRLPWMALFVPVFENLILLNKEHRETSNFHLIMTPLYYFLGAAVLVAAPFAVGLFVGKITQSLAGRVRPQITNGKDDRSTTDGEGARLARRGWASHADRPEHTQLAQAFRDKKISAQRYLDENFGADSEGFPVRFEAGISRIAVFHEPAGKEDGRYLYNNGYLYWPGHGGEVYTAKTVLDSKMHLWLELYNPKKPQERILRAIYYAPLKRFIFNREHLKYHILDPRNVPAPKDAVIINRMDDSSAHIYYAFTVPYGDGHKRVDFPRPQASRTVVHATMDAPPAATDSRLKRLYVLVEKGFVYGYLSPDEIHQSKAIAKWKWNSDTMQFTTEFFLVPGTLPWFFNVLKGVRPSIGPFYAQIRLDKEWSAQLFGGLHLRMGDAAYRGKHPPRRVLIVNSINEPSRLDVYRATSSDMDRGLFQRKGHLLYSSKYYNPETNILERPWQEFGRRFESFYKSGGEQVPDPVLFKLNSAREGRYMALMKLPNGSRANITIPAVHEGRFALARFIHDQGKLGVEVLVIDPRNWMPTVSLRRGYLDEFAGKFSWNSEERKLNAAEANVARADLARLGFVDPHEEWARSTFEASESGVMAAVTFILDPDRTLPEDRERKIAAVEFVIQHIDLLRYPSRRNTLLLLKTWAAESDQQSILSRLVRVPRVPAQTAEPIRPPLAGLDTKPLTTPEALYDWWMNAVPENEKWRAWTRSQIVKSSKINSLQVETHLAQVNARLASENQPQIHSKNDKRGVLYDWWTHLPDRQKTRLWSYSEIRRITGISNLHPIVTHVNERLDREKKLRIPIRNMSILLENWQALLPPGKKPESVPIAEIAQQIGVSPSAVYVNAPWRRGSATSRRSSEGHPDASAGGARLSDAQASAKTAVPAWDIVALLDGYEKLKEQGHPENLTRLKDRVTEKVNPAFFEAVESLAAHYDEALVPSVIPNSPKRQFAEASKVYMNFAERITSLIELLEWIGPSGHPMLYAHALDFVRSKVHVAMEGYRPDWVRDWEALEYRFRVESSDLNRRILAAHVLATFIEESSETGQISEKDFYLSNGYASRAEFEASAKEDKAWDWKRFQAMLLNYIKTGDPANELTKPHDPEAASASLKKLKISTAKPSALHWISEYYFQFDPSISSLAETSPIFDKNGWLRPIYTVSVDGQLMHPYGLAGVQIHSDAKVVPYWGSAMVYLLDLLPEGSESTAEVRLKLISKSKRYITEAAFLERINNGSHSHFVNVSPEFVQGLNETNFPTARTPNNDLVYLEQAADLVIGFLNRRQAGRRRGVLSKKELPAYEKRWKPGADVIHIVHGAGVIESLPDSLTAEVRFSKGEKLQVSRTSLFRLLSVHVMALLAHQADQTVTIAKIKSLISRGLLEPDLVLPRANVDVLAFDERRMGSILMQVKGIDPWAPGRYVLHPKQGRGIIVADRANSDWKADRAHVKVRFRDGQEQDVATASLELLWTYSEAAKKIASGNKTIERRFYKDVSRKRIRPHFISKGEQYYRDKLVERVQNAYLNPKPNLFTAGDVVIHDIHGTGTIDPLVSELDQIAESAQAKIRVVWDKGGQSSVLQSELRDVWSERKLIQEIQRQAPDLSVYYITEAVSKRGLVTADREKTMVNGRVARGFDENRLQSIIDILRNPALPIAVGQWVIHDVHRVGQVKRYSADRSTVDIEFVRGGIQSVPVGELRALLSQREIAEEIVKRHSGKEFNTVRHLIAARNIAPDHSTSNADFFDPNRIDEIEAEIFSADSPFAVGKRLLHPKYGVGTIPNDAYVKSDPGRVKIQYDEGVRRLSRQVLRPIVTAGQIAGEAGTTSETVERILRANGIEAVVKNPGPRGTSYYDSAVIDPIRTLIQERGSSRKPFSAEPERFEAVISGARLSEQTRRVFGFLVFDKILSAMQGSVTNIPFKMRLDEAGPLLVRAEFKGFKPGSSQILEIETGGILPISSATVKLLQRTIFDWIPFKESLRPVTDLDSPVLLNGEGRSVFHLPLEEGKSIQSLVIQRDGEVPAQVKEAARIIALRVLPAAVAAERIYQRIELDTSKVSAEVSEVPINDGNKNRLIMTVPFSKPVTIRAGQEVRVWWEGDQFLKDLDPKSLSTNIKITDAHGRDYHDYFPKFSGDAREVQISFTPKMAPGTTVVAVSFGLWIPTTDTDEPRMRFRGAGLGPVKGARLAPRRERPRSVRRIDVGLHLNKLKNKPDASTKIHRLFQPDRLEKLTSDDRVKAWKGLVKLSFGRLVKPVPAETAAADAANRYQKIVKMRHTLIHGRATPEGRVIFGRVWADFSEHANSEYELEMVRGVPVRIFFYNNQTAHEFFPILDSSGAVIGVHTGTVTPDTMRSLEDAVLETRLSKYGGLMIGGGKPGMDGELFAEDKRKTWAEFGVEHSYERVRVTVRNGLVHRVEFLETGHTEEFAKVWRKDLGRYVTTFWKKIYKEEFNQLDERYEIRDYQLNALGSVTLGLEPNQPAWLVFRGHGKKRVTIDGFVRNSQADRALVTSAVLALGDGTSIRIQNKILYTQPPNSPKAFLYNDNRAQSVFQNLGRVNVLDGRGKPHQNYVIRHYNLSTKAVVKVDDYWGAFGYLTVLDEDGNLIDKALGEALADVQVVDGKKRFVRLIRTADGRPIIDPKTGQAPILDMRAGLKDSSRAFQESAIPYLEPYTLVVGPKPEPVTENGFTSALKNFMHAWEQTRYKVHVNDRLLVREIHRIRRELQSEHSGDAVFIRKELLAPVKKRLAAPGVQDPRLVVVRRMLENLIVVLEGLSANPIKAGKALQEIERSGSRLSKNAKPAEFASSQKLKGLAAALKQAEAAAASVPQKPAISPGAALVKRQEDIRQAGQIIKQLKKLGADIEKTAEDIEKALGFGSQTRLKIEKREVVQLNYKILLANAERLLEEWSTIKRQATVNRRQAAKLLETAWTLAQNLDYRLSVLIEKLGISKDYRLSILHQRPIQGLDYGKLIAQAQALIEEWTRAGQIQNELLQSARARLISADVIRAENQRWNMEAVLAAARSGEEKIKAILPDLEHAVNGVFYMSLEAYLAAREKELSDLERELTKEKAQIETLEETLRSRPARRRKKEVDAADEPSPARDPRLQEMTKVYKKKLEGHAAVVSLYFDDITALLVLVDQIQSKKSIYLKITTTEKLVDALRARPYIPLWLAVWSAVQDQADETEDFTFMQSVAALRAVVLDALDRSQGKGYRPVEADAASFARGAGFKTTHDLNAFLSSVEIDWKRYQAAAEFYAQVYGTQSWKPAASFLVHPVPASLIRTLVDQYKEGTTASMLVGQLFMFDHAYSSGMFSVSDGWLRPSFTISIDGKVIDPSELSEHFIDSASTIYIVPWIPDWPRLTAGKVVLTGSEYIGLEQAAEQLEKNLRFPPRTLLRRLQRAAADEELPLTQHIGKKVLIHRSALEWIELRFQSLRSYASIGQLHAQLRRQHGMMDLTREALTRLISETRSIPRVHWLDTDYFPPAALAIIVKILKPTESNRNQRVLSPKELQSQTAPNGPVDVLKRVLPADPIRPVVSVTAENLGLMAGDIRSSFLDKPSLEVERIGHLISAMGILNGRVNEYRNKTKKEWTSDPVFVKALANVMENLRGGIGETFGNAKFRENLELTLQMIIMQTALDASGARLARSSRKLGAQSHQQEAAGSLDITYGLHATIARYAHSLGANRMDAQDLASDAIVWAYEHPANAQAKPDWFVDVVRERFQAARQEKIQVTPISKTNQPIVPFDDSDRRNQGRVVEGVVRGMFEPYRLALYLLMDGHTPEKMAALAGLPLGISNSYLAGAKSVFARRYREALQSTPGSGNQAGARLTEESDKPVVQEPVRLRVIKGRRPGNREPIVRSNLSVVPPRSADSPTESTEEGSAPVRDEVVLSDRTTDTAASESRLGIVPEDPELERSLSQRFLKAYNRFVRLMRGDRNAGLTLVKTGRGEEGGQEGGRLAASPLLPGQVSRLGWSGYRLQFTNQFLASVPIDQGLRDQIAGAVENIRRRMHDPVRLIRHNSDWGHAAIWHEAHLPNGYRLYFTFSASDLTVTLLLYANVKDHKAPGDYMALQKGFVDALNALARDSGAISRDQAASLDISAWIFSGFNEDEFLSHLSLARTLAAYGPDILVLFRAMVFNKVNKAQTIPELLGALEEIERSKPALLNSHSLPLRQTWNEIDAVFSEAQWDTGAAVQALVRSERSPLLPGETEALHATLSEWHELSTDIRRHIKEVIVRVFRDTDGLHFGDLNKLLLRVQSHSIQEEVRRQFEKWADERIRMALSESIQTTGPDLFVAAIRRVSRAYDRLRQGTENSSYPFISEPVERHIRQFNDGTYARLIQAARAEAAAVPKPPKPDSAGKFEVPADFELKLTALQSPPKDSAQPAGQPKEDPSVVAIFNSERAQEVFDVNHSIDYFEKLDAPDQNRWNAALAKARAHLNKVREIEGAVILSDILWITPRLSRVQGFDSTLLTDELLKELWVILNYPGLSERQRFYAAQGLSPLKGKIAMRDIHELTRLASPIEARQTAREDQAVLLGTELPEWDLVMDGVMHDFDVKIRASAGDPQSDFYGYDSIYGAARGYMNALPSLSPDETRPVYIFLSGAAALNGIPVGYLSKLPPKVNIYLLTPALEDVIAAAEKRPDFHPIAHEGRLHASWIRSPLLSKSFTDEIRNEISRFSHPQAAKEAVRKVIDKYAKGIDGRDPIRLVLPEVIRGESGGPSMIVLLDMMPSLMAALQITIERLIESGVGSENFEAAAPTLKSTALAKSQYRGDVAILKTPDKGINADLSLLKPRPNEFLKTMAKLAPLVYKSLDDVIFAVSGTNKTLVFSVSLGVSDISSVEGKRARVPGSSLWWKSWEEYHRRDLSKRFEGAQLIYQNDVTAGRTDRADIAAGGMFEAFWLNPESVERADEHDSTVAINPVTTGARLAKTDLAEFFTGLAQAFPRLNLSLFPVREVWADGKTHLFEFRQEGGRLAAYAQGFETIYFEKNITAPARSQTRADEPSISDLLMIENTLNEAVGARLSDFKAGPTIVQVDTGILPQSSWEAYGARLTQDLRRVLALPIAGENGRDIAFVATGPQAARLSAMDPKLFSTEKASELAARGARLSQMVLPENSSPSAVNVPVQALSEGEIPAFFAAGLLTVAAAWVDPRSLPPDFLEAWALLSGSQPDAATLAAILMGTAALAKILQYTLKPLARVSDFLRDRYFKLLTKRMTAQSA